MKKISLVLYFLFVSNLLNAQDRWVDKLKYETGGFVFQTPFVDPSVAWCYDFIGKESLLAGEGTILYHEAFKEIGVTFGGAVDASGGGDGELREKAREFIKSGTPFIGIKYTYDLTKKLHFGCFLGRNLIEGKNIAGLKTAYEIRFW